MPQAPFIRVLGSSDWLPTAGGDGACYTISDHLLLDTGWHADMRIMDAGLDFARLHTIVITHAHADHILSLPALLMRCRILRGSFEGLTLAGPKEIIHELYARTHALLCLGDGQTQAMRPPRIVGLAPGDVLNVGGETVVAAQALHSVPALGYRITHNATGRSVAFSGDTGYQPAYGQAFQGVDLLVHECTLGPYPVATPGAPAHHSSAQEAARIAVLCGAGRLLLTHTKPGRVADSVKAASRMAQCPVMWAEPGQTYAY